MVDITPFLVEIFLISIFLIIFYQTKCRGKVEKAIWVIVILIISISIVEFSTCGGYGSFNLCGILTIFIDLGLAMIDLIVVSIFIFGKIGDRLPKIKR